MKNFTTPEYITPIIEEIKTIYKPAGGPEALRALNCLALLQQRRGRAYMAIRTPEAGAFFYYGKAARKVYAELESWTAAAETEPGELDRWRWAEENRIQEAIREALIRGIIEAYQDTEV